MASRDKPTITSDYGLYVKDHLSPVLVRALAEIAEYRPKDPIEYLANFLYQHKAKHPEEEEVAVNKRDDLLILDKRGDEVDESVRNPADHVHIDCLKKLSCVGDIFDEGDLS